MTLMHMETIPEATGFYAFPLPPAANPFAALQVGVTFEAVGKGRLGNHLSAAAGQGHPIVRTTTAYSVAACPFGSAHQALADTLLATAPLHGVTHPIPAFNHALIEVYDRDYAKMGFHSDQALDLASGSFIALYSCYEAPDRVGKHHLRRLNVQDKVTGQAFEFILHHNSVVLFSLATNARHLHKIELSKPPHPKSTDPDNRWLGITFRTSKTWVEFRDGQPILADGIPLTLADATQQKEFFQLRGQENRSLDFVYPQIPYTLSPADLMALMH